MRIIQYIRNGNTWCKCVVVLVMLLLIGSFTVGCISEGHASQATPSTVTGAVDTSKPLALYDEDVITSLYQRTIPAVVEVNTVVKQVGSGFWNFNQPSQRGQGSGFLIDEAGHILTNYHVVDSASEVKVVLQDSRTLDAEVLGTDQDDDLALLKVDPSKVSSIAPLSLGDSDTAKPGQMAIALGAPFGLEGSITVGVISGKGRSMTGVAGRTITDVLQTDAAINSGNSGGPLLNSRGEVIGINTAIELSSSGATGIGYAIPINTAKSVLSSLIAGEEVHRPWLGIEGVAITSDLAKTLDLSVESGVYIVGIMADSPAEDAGLIGSGTDRYGELASGGDIVTAVDDQPVAKVEDMVKYFNTKKPGDKVSLSVIREGKSISVDAILEEWPEEMPSTEIESLPFPELP